jgi:uncharacterized protein (TIGR04255 family)
MPFPAVQRVVYARKPLVEVICQLRFSPILIIDSETPARFQESIRHIFPNFSESTEIQQEILPNMNFPISSGIMNQPSRISTNKIYSFTSGDNNWTLNLTRTFLALSSKSYHRWEDFFDKFKKPIEALQEIYKVVFYTRIGLRYIDVFCRLNLGLCDTPWQELVQPFILGLSSSAIADCVLKHDCKYEVILDDKKSIARIATSFIKNTSTAEDCFKVDSDFYTSINIPVSDVISNLDFLHDRSSRLLRFLIQEKLHKAMEPSDLI